MELIKYNIENAVITALANKYDIKEIKDSTDYAFVMGGLRECRQIRHKVDEWHKERKADIVKAANFYDGERRRIKTLVATVEDPLKDVRQAEDDRREAIKAAKETAERMRIEAIQVQIASIRSLGLLHNTPSSSIKEYLSRIQDMKISEDTYMEFVDQAIQAQWETITSLKELLIERLQFEKEDAERRAAAEHLEKVRKEQEEAQKKIDEENQRIKERREELDEADREFERKAKREEFERQATIKAEQEAKEKIERETRERLEREEAEAKEKAQREAMKPDREKLIGFGKWLYILPMPICDQLEAQKIITEARSDIREIADKIKAQAKTL